MNWTKYVTTQNKIWLALVVLPLLAFLPGGEGGRVAAQAGGNNGQGQEAREVTLTVRLRYSDGRAAAGEVVQLARLPEDTGKGAISCVTDETGRCAWPVTRGLYQVLFDRPLDLLTAMALADGGLRGLGVTVGEVDITYHFTFHSGGPGDPRQDSHVFFDLAPEAAVPVPKIPTEAEVHAHAYALPVLDALTETLPVTPTQILSPTAVMTNTAVGMETATAENPSTTPIWLLLAVLAGAGTGWLAWRWRGDAKSRGDEGMKP